MGRSQLGEGGVVGRLPYLASGSTHLLVMGAQIFTPAQHCGEVGSAATLFFRLLLKNTERCSHTAACIIFPGRKPSHIQPRILPNFTLNTHILIFFHPSTSKNIHITF